MRTSVKLISRFRKNEICVIKGLLEIPENAICNNRSKVDGLQALVYFLNDMHTQREVDDD